MAAPNDWSADALNAVKDLNFVKALAGDRKKRKQVLPVLTDYLKQTSTTGMQKLCQAIFIAFLSSNYQV